MNLAIYLRTLPRKSVEDVTWFHLDAYSKMRDDKFHQWRTALACAHEFQTACELPFLTAKPQNCVCQFFVYSYIYPLLGSASVVQF